MVTNELTGLKEQVKCKLRQIDEQQVQPSFQPHLADNEIRGKNNPEMDRQSSPAGCANRKMNLVLFGIDECIEGTRGHTRVHQDFERAGSVLSQIEPSVTEANIRECY